MEFRLIDRIRELTAQPRDDVRLGIGDDAAVLAVPAGQELVVAIDTMVEGTHFLPGTAPVDLGWKALAVNLSDLAAMGATPAWALLALTLPKADAPFVDGFAEGFAQLAQPRSESGRRPTSTLRHQITSLLKPPEIVSPRGNTSNQKKYPLGD